MLSRLFLTALGQSSWSTLLIHLVLLAIVSLLSTQDHGSLPSKFGIVVPHWLLPHRRFFFSFIRVFEGLLSSIPCPLLSKRDATLIVVEIES